MLRFIDVGSGIGIIQGGRGRRSEAVGDIMLVTQVML